MTNTYYSTDHTMSFPPVFFTHLRMDPEEKEEWIAALLSGEYEQGTRVLRRVDGAACCLGVYCEIKDIPKFVSYEEAFMQDGEQHLINVYAYGTDGPETRGFNRTFIPSNYGIKLYDTRDGRGYVTDLYGRETLFYMDLQGKPDDAPARTALNRMAPLNLPMLNDDGFTFEQIADVIRYFL